MNKYIKISTLVLLTTLLTFANASENNVKNKELKVSNQLAKTVKAVTTTDSNSSYESDFNTSTRYETGANYGSNINERQHLLIPDAKSLLVTITGSIEKNFDCLIITDGNGIYRMFTGELNDTITVKGNSIDIEFVSDESNSDIGASVTIEDVSYYDTGADYANNTFETKVLAIPNAEALTVTIAGSIEEDSDFITITDENGSKTVFTGELNESFIVDGSSIDVNFTSNESNTDFGAIVTIDEAGIVAPE